MIGDFNIPNTRWERHELAVDFIPMIVSNEKLLRQSDMNELKVSAPREIAIETTSKFMDNGLFQMCDFKNNWGNVLDLVYTNMPELLVVNTPDFMLLPEGKSDPAHMPTMCTIEVSPEIHPVDQCDSRIYCFRKENYDSIREHLMQINFVGTFSICDGV